MPTACNASMKCCRQRNWHIQTISTDMDANYYTTYLKAYLTDAGDARKDDDDFISARPMQHQKSMRCSAVPVLHQPALQELAMAVLMEGLE